VHYVYEFANFQKIMYGSLTLLVSLRRDARLDDEPEFITIFHMNLCD
jgi:hypothetical protein